MCPQVCKCCGRDRGAITIPELESNPGRPGQSPGPGMVSIENKRRENKVWDAREKYGSKSEEVEGTCCRILF